MREFRLFLWFCVGVLMSAVLTLPAMAATGYLNDAGQCVSGQQWCSEHGYTTFNPALETPWGLGRGCYSPSAGYYINLTQSMNSCTYTPSCTPPQVLNATTGQCETPPNPCASKTNTAGSDWFYATGAGTDVGSNTCIDGCQATVSSKTPSDKCTFNSAGLGTCLRGVDYNYMYTGQSCSGATPPRTATDSGTPANKPACAPDQGVLTSSSGNVACVPAGTPQFPNETPAPRKPAVSKEKEVESFPDGSTKTTETTKTCDPATGACETTKSTTNTAASNGMAGQAGTPGTTNSSTTNNYQAGSSQSGATNNATGNSGGGEKTGFCAENPNLQICKNDIATEKTAQKIVDSLDTSKASADHITGVATGNPELKAGLDDVTGATVTKAQQVGGPGDDAAGKQEEFRQLMSGGWFDTISMTGCSPISGSFGGRSFTLDHCPTAAKISEAGAYALWVLFAFFGITLITRKAE